MDSKRVAILREHVCAVGTRYLFLNTRDKAILKRVDILSLDCLWLPGNKYPKKFHNFHGVMFVVFFQHYNFILVQC